MLLDQSVVKKLNYVESSFFPMCGSADLLRIYIYIYIYTVYIYIYIHRVSQEECARLRESVPYVKVYRYNPKHLYPKLNGYRDNGHRSLKL